MKSFRNNNDHNNSYNTHGCDKLKEINPLL